MAGAEDLTPQEVAAALAARRELGPEYEQEIASALADRLEQRVRAEVETRRDALPSEARVHEQTGKDAAQQTGVAIASVLAGSATTFATAGQHNSATLIALTWGGIATVNVVFALSRRRRRR